MGIIEKVKHTLFSRNGIDMVPYAHFATRSDTMYAPISGLLVSMEQINDESIATGLFGQGYGIIPVGLDVIYAPCEGRICATTVTNHAIGIRSSTGLEIVIHIGLDTVKMNGKHFKRYVEENQIVKAGEPLISFDSKEIKRAGFEDIITCVVSNTDAFTRVEYVGESSTLLNDCPLVKIGDPLLVVR